MGMLCRLAFEVAVIAATSCPFHVIIYINLPFSRAANICPLGIAPLLQVQLCLWNSNALNIYI